MGGICLRRTQRPFSALQAGGHRFDPDTLHSDAACRLVVRSDGWPTLDWDRQPLEAQWRGGHTLQSRSRHTSWTRAIRSRLPCHVLRDLRGLCANFREPPRLFRSRTARSESCGWYRVEFDIVAVDTVEPAATGWVATTATTRCSCASSSTPRGIQGVSTEPPLATTRARGTSWRKGRCSRRNESSWLRSGSRWRRSTGKRQRGVRRGRSASVLTSHQRSGRGRVTPGLASATTPVFRIFRRPDFGW